MEEGVCDGNVKTITNEVLYFGSGVFLRGLIERDGNLEIDVVVDYYLIFCYVRTVKSTDMFCKCSLLRDWHFLKEGLETNDIEAFSCKISCD